MPTIKRAERLQIMLTEGEVAALDDWRFKTRMPSRASAIRELLRRGLTAEGFVVAEQGARSGSFGIVRGSETDAGTGSGLGARRLTAGTARRNAAQERPAELAKARASRICSRARQLRR